MKKVTFGIVNCNRLFYLKSCVETLLDTTSDYENKEFIVVDNASVESGTPEYLSGLEERGFRVIRRTERDPANEFAIGLNLIRANATGDYLCPLQGDMQFVLHGWLGPMVEFYEKNLDVVGSIVLDAQRRVTHAGRQIVRFVDSRQPNWRNVFYADLNREPIAPAADAFYSRKVIEQIGPWSENNKNHEGSMDSENDMRYRVLGMVGRNQIPKYVAALTSVPPAIAIYTDPRGTQGRVRGNRRYGSYWGAKDDTGTKYYEYLDILKMNVDRVNSIEDVARPIGYDKPIDATGAWLKNPIRPETATPNDWVELT